MTSHMGGVSHDLTSHMGGVSHDMTSHMGGVSHDMTSHMDGVSHDLTSHVCQHSPKVLCSNSVHGVTTSTLPQDKAVTAAPKPSLLVRLKEATLHTITGFKLFWLDVKISWRLLRKTMRGETLTRREQKQVCPG